MSVTVERSEYYRVRYVIQNNIDYHSRTLSLTEDGEAVGFIVVGEGDGGDEGNDVGLELGRELGTPEGAADGLELGSSDVDSEGIVLGASVIATSNLFRKMQRSL
jgi:hypothetical protein